MNKNTLLSAAIGALLGIGIVILSIASWQFTHDYRTLIYFDTAALALIFVIAYYDHWLPVILERLKEPKGE